MSYSQAEQRVQNDYLSALQAGAVTPASSVIGSLNFILLIGWLLACRSVSDLTFQRSRLLVFVGIAYISLWNLVYTRSIGVVGSVGVGLNSAVCTILAVNFVLLHDPRSFKRLILQPAAGALTANGPTDLKRDADVHDERGPKFILTWEPMPKLIWRRLFWVLDLITGFRGVHWSWNPSPSPPYHLSLSNACSSRTASFPRNGSHFLMDYFLIDLIKCLMIADPYFIGYPPRRPPPHIAPYITSPLGLYSYRMLLAAVGVYIAIDLVFAFAVLLQVNILGPSVLGLNASPVTFPPLWGSPRAVLRKGLKGFWGETWHQMFRMHFVTVGDAVAKFLLRDDDPGSCGRPSADKRRHGCLEPSVARLRIRVVTVFLLSGALHACASYTLLGPTRPWVPFLFFALQPLGMAIQSACSQHFVGSYLCDSPGHWKTLLVRQGSNFGFAILWLWAWSGMFLDDMTNGGIWLFEPIPISLIRGLGFSKEDKRFWCW